MTVPESNHSIFKALFAAFGVWLFGFLGGNLVLALAPAVWGIKIAGGTPSAWVIAISSAVAQPVCLALSWLLVIAIHVAIAHFLSKKQKSDFNDYAVTFSLLISLAPVTLLALTAGDFAVLELFGSYKALSSTHLQLLCASGAVSLVESLVLVCAYAIWRHAQTSAIKDSRLKEAEVLMTEAAKRGVDTRSYEDHLGRARSLEDVNWVVLDLQERRGFDQRLADLRELGVDTAPYQEALNAFQPVVTRKSMVPLLNAMTRRTFVARDMNWAIGRGVHVEPYAAELATIETLLQCPESIDVLIERLDSLRKNLKGEKISSAS